ncbi:hypothetical protein [Corticicoccus populi]|uniref:Uncharacterized protein n=1 Tax=Corticicoccus populi TaxID=1812821 RepID=A0ABW5WXP1_9STAP
MDTELNLTLLTERLTAYQISRAVDIDEQMAQKIIEQEVSIDELEPQIIYQLKELNDKLLN